MHPLSHLLMPALNMKLSYQKWLFTSRSVDTLLKIALLLYIHQSFLLMWIAVSTLCPSQLRFQRMTYWLTKLTNFVLEWSSFGVSEVIRMDRMRVLLKMNTWVMILRSPVLSQENQAELGLCRALKWCLALVITSKQGPKNDLFGI